MTMSRLEVLLDDVSTKADDVATSVVFANYDEAVAQATEMVAQARKALAFVELEANIRRSAKVTKGMAAI